MNLSTTLLLMALTAGILGLSLWRARADYVPGRPPLLPHGLVQFVCLILLLLLAGHVISLLTGTPWRGRF